MKKFYAFLALIALVATGMQAQIITSSPALLQEASKNVVLTFHADSPQCNGGLKNLPASTEVYVHIGAITNLSTSVSDWKYAPSKWGDNSAKYKLKYVAANTYELNMGDMRAYFGITNPNEHVEKLACVFRNADCTKECKTSSGGDIFVDILEPGYQVRLSHNGKSNVVNDPTTLTFTVDVTTESDITLSVNGNQIGSASNAMALTKDYRFASEGSYEVVATATAGSETRTSTIVIAYPKASVAKNYPGGTPQMGAVENADGTITFCLAAPQKKSVVLVPSWDDYQVLEKNSMYYHDYNGYRYFWVNVPAPAKGQYHYYYYLVDGAMKVADPYAHLVLDPYSDKWIDSSIWPSMPKYPYDRFDDTLLAVYKSDLDDYKFAPFDIPETSNLTVYEMLFRDFTGTEGQAYGNGTIRQAIDKLSYIKNLGVNAVELMPVMEFNGNNSWGYNTNFYMAPDKSYGSPDDLKEFIDKCHQMGMAVILDIVFNQSDGLHPWYQMYPSNANPFYNQYAPHDYSVLNDWNQDNPLVQQQWKDVLTYWLTKYNVDGFRFDLVKGLGSNSSYGGGTENYNSSRIANMKRLHQHIKDVKPRALHINEHLAGHQEENEMAADGQLNWANISYGSQQYAMGYAEGSGQLTRFLSSRDSRTWGSTVAYAESHDEQRVAYSQANHGVSAVKGSASVRMNRLGQLAAHMLLTPGPKMVWQFGELGADESTKTSDGGNMTDPKKVIWSNLDNPHRKNLHDTYAALCGIRTCNPELFTQSATFVTSGITDNVTAARTLRVQAGTKEVVAFINPNVSGTKLTVTANVSNLNASNAKLLCSSNNFNPPATLTNASANSVSIIVPANGYAVFATENTVGVDDTIADSVSTSAVAFGAEGEIVILGEYNNVSVYTISGQAVNSLKVAPGIYIVNIDGNATKVIVK